LRPESRGEHPAEAPEGIDIPFEKCVEGGFGVAPGMEPVTGLFQFLAQFRVVIQFSVEDQDGIALVGRHGLIAVLKVDDAEPHGSQRHFGGFPDTLLVRSAMNQRSRDFPDPIRIGSSPKMSEPSYPAHVSESPPFLPPRKKAFFMGLSIPHLSGY
jgi:hypothetical protein